MKSDPRPLRSCALALALGLWVPFQLPAEAVRGVVYDDLNDNRRRDPGEPGVPSVRVSNGINVVLTDGDGAYVLEVPDEVVVFVTKPSGYATPVNGHNLPQFYYVHSPEGSPSGLRYAGVEPTGPLPGTLDFPLRKQAEPGRFEAILFADTQPQTSAELDYMRDDVIAGLIGTPARFGMTLGDILFDDLSMFPRYNALIAQLGIPWYNVPGNHDMNYRAPGDAHSLETFKRFYGPPYYSFEYADACFVVLDNIVYQGTTADNSNGKGGYEARLTEQQLQWLENDLRHVPREKLVVLTMHAPLKTSSSDSESANTVNRRELFRLLAGRPHLFALAGHTHTTEHHYFGGADGFDGPGEFHHHILTTVSGSWWSGPIDDRGIAVAEQRDGTPNGYHILEVEGTDVRVRYRAAGKAEDYQMRIMFDVAHHQLEAVRDFRPGELLGGPLSTDALAAARVVVNFFDGGPTSQVRCSIGGRAPVPMTRTPGIDPHTRELFARHADTLKSWVSASPSSHLFVADLPADLEPGTYTVTVVATDEYGRVHHGHRVLEVIGTSAGDPAMQAYPAE